MPRILLFLLLSLATSSACLWDRDTLAEETKGRPEVLKIIVGWFDRYPNRYYEMRLERVAHEIVERPGDLGLYDDAAVACDRLGRSDDAIGWMEKKKRILDTLPAAEIKDHRYRYLSNLGTFKAHRWIRQPEAIRNADLSPLREAEGLIAQAIEENPDAHFGREVYQLNAIRWMLWDGKLPIEPDRETDLEFSPDSWIHVSYGRLPMPQGEVDPHISGITGLIQLGAAWQNLDAFHALTGVLESREYASLAELSYLREKELLTQGVTSIHPLAEVREQVAPKPVSLLVHRKPVTAFYPVARKAAEARNKAWTAYQSVRFAKGMHPDTHPDFWNEWKEPPLPKIPGPSMVARFGKLLDRYPLLLLLIFPVLWVLSRILRRLWGKLRGRNKTIPT